MQRAVGGAGQAAYSGRHAAGGGTGDAIRDSVWLCKAYAYRCAMTGLRLITDSGHIAVVSARVPWSVSNNDDPTNGIALSPTCHWAFDEGLLTITHDYKIKTSPQLVRGQNIPHAGRSQRRAHSPARRQRPAPDHGPCAGIAEVVFVGGESLRRPRDLRSFVVGYVNGRGLLAFFVSRFPIFDG
ncbi:MAG: HNH endonuclease [Caldilineaceae bacterium]